MRQASIPSVVVYVLASIALTSVLGRPATAAVMDAGVLTPTRDVDTSDQDSAALVRELRTKTLAQLEKDAAALDGVIGYTIVDLTTGEFFDRMPNVPFPTASTIKLAILFELVKRADESTLSLEDRVTLDRRRAVPGGLLHELGTPTLSLRDYATAMIVDSDNTATNVLITQLGMDAVTARMKRLGLDSIRLRRNMIDLEAARKGLENVGSPSDIARLLTLFHAGPELSANARHEALTLLMKAKSTPIRRAIPTGIDVASKPGGLEGVATDAAIVLLKNRPFVIVVMTTFLQDEAAGNATIQRLAETAYGYYSRLAAGDSQTGRQLNR